MIHDHGRARRLDPGRSSPRDSARRSNMRRFLLASALCTAATSVQAAVLVVSGGGPALRDAIAAAADGDTVLVKSGAYWFFTLSSKSLTIVADKGETVTTIPEPFGFFS